MATSLSATQQTTAPKVNPNMQTYRNDYDYSEAPGKSAQPNTMLDCRMEATRKLYEASHQLGNIKRELKTSADAFLDEQSSR